MKVLFHGGAARKFRGGIEDLLDEPHDIAEIGEDIRSDDDRGLFARAEVIVGTSLTPSMPAPERLRLFHSPGAGYNNIRLDLLPPAAALCNCFGHEQGIAEYVIAALLARYVPLRDADADLRCGVWELGGGNPVRLRDEMGTATIGILGYGHIGRTIARLARAFGMGVTALARRPIDGEPTVDRAFRPADLHAFMGSADAIVLAVPLTPETEGMINAAALAAMRREAVLINVARGHIVDEQALFDALAARSIGGAVIDTWYVYPDAAHPAVLPSKLPFHTLDNVVMTPHMSGWTRQLIARRRQAIADNINNLAAGRDLANVVRPAIRP